MQEDGATNDGEKDEDGHESPSDAEEHSSYMHACMCVLRSNSDKYHAGSWGDCKRIGEGASRTLL